MCDEVSVSEQTSSSVLTNETQVDRARATYSCCQVIENTSLGMGMGLVTLEAPIIASSIKPGQFVHLCVSDPESVMILRRPLSVCAYNAELGIISIFYQVKGKGTKALAQVEKGRKLDLIGPIGRPWIIPNQTSKALLVGGGVGCAPLTPLYHEMIRRGIDVKMIRGAQNANMMKTLSVLDNVECDREMILTTDDGSIGYHGFVTEPARECLKTEQYDYVATCGPEIMQKLIAGIAADAGVYCEVSLERRMACAVGACLSCVVDTVNGKKRACIDGPVFDASVVRW